MPYVVVCVVGVGEGRPVGPCRAGPVVRGLLAGGQEAGDRVVRALARPPAPAAVAARGTDRPPEADGARRRPHDGGVAARDAADPEEQVEIFGADWQPAWVEEAEDRWGDSAQWAQYAQRAARMTPEDWKATAAATETLSADLAAAKRAGVAPGSDAANALAERHRAMISAYLDCTHAMQVCVGRMYVDDPGYAEYYDALAPGLTVWLREVDLRERRGAGRRPGVREVGVIAARPGAGRPGAGAAATVGAGQSTGTSVR